MVTGDFVETAAATEVFEKMSNSKESKPNVEAENRVIEGGGIVSIIYSAAKKVAIVGVVYFMGES